MSLHKDLKIQIIEDDKASSDIFNYKFVYDLPPDLKFSGFDSIVLDNLKTFLQTKSSLVDLDSKYKQNPELLSYHRYGTPDFWYLLLYVNDIFTKLDFIKDQIFIPTKPALAYFVSNGLTKKERTIVQKQG